MPNDSPTWQADHVRVTLFRRELWDIDPAKIIDGIGVPVDATGSRPAFAEKTASASVDTITRIEIKQTINRLDWILLPRVEQVFEAAGPGPGVALMADASYELDRLILWVSQWLSSVDDPITRIAVGCGAMLPAKDRDWSYEKLAQLLPIKLDSKRDSDFQLRLNRPLISSTVGGLTVNVLASWASVQFTSSFVGIVGGSSGPISQLGQDHFVQAALDVNTDANRVEALPKENLTGLLNELKAISLRLLAEGVK